MPTNRELQILLTLKDQASKEMKKLSGFVQKNAASFRKVGIGMGLVGGAITAGIGIAVKETALAEGAMNKFNTVFAENTGDMMNFVNDIRKEMPTATSDIIRMAAGLQDLLIPLGLGRAEATKLTQGFLNLSNKLAAFNDVNPQEVLEAMTSGLTGMTRPLRQFGINASEAALQSIALKEGLLKTGQTFSTVTPEVKNQARAQALLILATKQSADAIAGFEANQDSFLRRTQELSATLKDMREVIGRVVMPILDDLLKKILPIIEKIGKWTEENPKLTETIIILTAALGAIMLVLGPILAVLPGLIAMIPILGVVIGALLSPIAIIIAAIVALVAVSIYWYKHWDEMKEGISMIWKAIKDIFWWGVGSVTTSLQDLIKIIFAFSKDAWNTFKNFGQNVKNVFYAISLAMKGQFKEAFNTMEEAVKSNLSGTTVALENFSAHQRENAQEFKKTWSNMGTINLDELQFATVSLDNFKKSAVKKITEVKDNFNNLDDSTGGSAKNIAENITKLKDNYEDFAEKAGDSLIELKEDHAKNLKSVRNDIEKTKKSMDDLNESYTSERKSDVQKVAEQVVSTEERIAEIQKSLQGDVSEERRAELQGELSKMQMAYEANAEFIKSIESEVAEARRVSGLTDIERAIEEYQQRRAMAEAEFGEKMSRLRKELETFQNKEKTEIALYKRKEELIKEMQKAASESYSLMMKNNLAITKESIEAEIDLYKRLAAAIAKVRGGNAKAVARAGANFGGGMASGGTVNRGTSYLVGEQGPELFTPSSSGKIIPGGSGIVVNITGNNISSDMDLENIAERVGDAILSKLNLSQRLAF